MLTLAQVKDRVQADSIGRRKDGTIIVRQGYFYRNGMTAEKYAGIVAKLVPDATVVNFGDKWAPFRGGASLANSSHFWVVLSTTES